MEALGRKSNSNYTKPLLMRTPSRNELLVTSGWRFSMAFDSEYSFRPAGLNEMWYCSPSAKMPTVRPSKEIVCILDLTQTKGSSYEL